MSVAQKPKGGTLTEDGPFAQNRQPNGVAACGFALTALRQSARLDLAQQLLRPLGEAVAGAIEPEHRGRAVAVLQHGDTRTMSDAAELVLQCCGLRHQMRRIV